MRYRVHVDNVTSYVEDRLLYLLIREALSLGYEPKEIKISVCPIEGQRNLINEGIWSLWNSDENHGMKMGCSKETLAHQFWRFNGYQVPPKLLRYELMREVARGRLKKRQSTSGHSIFEAV